MIRGTFEEYGQPYSPTRNPNTYTSVAPQTYLEAMAVLWDLKPKDSLEDGKRLPIQKP